MRTLLLVSSAALALAACQKSGQPASGTAQGNPAATTSAATSAPAAPAAAAAPASTAVSLPTRKAGLWEQTISRDGKATPMGKIRTCVDASTDAKASVFGQKMGDKMCTQHSVNRALDGSYSFTSTCKMGAAGTVATTGTASGDFSSNYHIRSESTVTGASYSAINGHHVTEMTVTYMGPCPTDMGPGDVMLSNGMKINTNKLAGAASGAGG